MKTELALAMNDPDKLLQRLAAATRSDGDPYADELPLGLATRVLAKLREGRAPTLWETFALGALPVAAVITIACVMLGSPETQPPDDADVIAQVMLETELTTSR